MAGTIGCPSIAFGSNVLAFLASDGITETGPTTEDVECTPDGAVDDSFESGDVINWGGFGGNVIADDTVSVTELVGTTEAITVITYPQGTHTTPRTNTGAAYMKSAARSGTKNGKNLYAVEFTWKTKPTEALAT